MMGEKPLIVPVCHWEDKSGRSAVGSLGGAVICSGHAVEALPRVLRLVGGRASRNVEGLEPAPG